MNNKKILSKRGQKVHDTVLRVDFELFFEANQDIYHKETNPNGKFPLNTAENKQSWPLLKEKMEMLLLEKSIPNWVANYTSCLGDESFRIALAGFLSKFLTKCPINPDHLGVSAGATAIVEMTAWLLADAGDVLVLPTPSYPVYKQDIGNKPNLERYDLVTHHEISDLKNKPALKIKHLKKAKKEIEKQGKKFKVLVLTTPDNPTGEIYTKKQLNRVADYCIKNRIHLIVNEIYGLSIINTNHPAIKEDYSKQRTFTSFAQIMAAKKSPYLHLWYALSKDMGISGFRVGAVYSHNEAFIKAYDNLNAPHLVSNHTQWLLGEILSDYAFMEKYIAHNQLLLTESYALVVQYLKKLNVPYVPSRGSLFVWADFSEFLKKPTLKAETQFWELLYEKTGVLLTPGEGFGHSKKGLYRIVFPCFDKQDLEVAMERLAVFLQEFKK